jgi:hypothetical protein
LKTDHTCGTCEISSAIGYLFNICAEMKCPSGAMSGSIAAVVAAKRPIFVIRYFGLFLNGRFRR